MEAETGATHPPFSQGPLAAPGAGGGRQGPPLEPPEEAWPARLGLDFWLPELREDKTREAIRFVVTRHSSSRKLTHLTPHPSAAPAPPPTFQCQTEPRGC